MRWESRNDLACGRTTNSFERVHDTRVVRTSEVQRESDHDRDRVELGPRPFRIHVSGPGESHRIERPERYPTEGDPGSDHARRLHGDRVLSFRRNFEVE